MRDLRLALALVRGAGPADLIRLTTMALGVAGATLAILVGLAAPRVSSAADAVRADRAPVGQEGRAGLQVSSSQTVLDGRVWTQTSASDVTADSPRPPGVSAWPSPGTTLASPALLALAGPDHLIDGVRLDPYRTIGSAGLTDPQELLSYAVVDSAVTSRDPGASTGSADEASAAVVSFGDPSARPDSGGGPLTLVTLVLLVLAPALLFLLTALRLSARSRRRRFQALVLVGLTPSRAARVYAWEMAAVAGIGSILGAVAYDAVQGALGRSGLLGIAWWPGQASLGPATTAVVVVLVALAVRGIARRAFGVPPLREREADVVGPSSTRTVVGIVLLVPALGFLAVTTVRGLLRPSAIWAADGYALVVAGAVVLAVVGVVVLAPDLVSRAAPRLPGRGSPGVALGLSGAAYRQAANRRFVAFVSAAVLVCGLGAGFLGLLRGSSLGDPDQARISVDLAQVATGAGWTRRLPAGPLTIDTSARVPGGAVGVVIGDCPAVDRQSAAVFGRGGPCVDAPQQGTGGVGPAVPTSVRIGAARVPVPTATGAATPDVTWRLKYPLAAAPWLDGIREGQLTYWVSRDSAAYGRILGELHRAYPGARIDAGPKNADQYPAYLQQSGTVRAGLAIGLTLSLGAFLLAAVESRRERVRSVTALVALGTPRRALRLSFAVEVAVPVLLGGLAAAVVGILGGWAVLSFHGTADMASARVVEWSAGALVVAVVVAALTGWSAGAARFDREALADR